MKKILLPLILIALLSGSSGLIQTESNQTAPIISPDIQIPEMVTDQVEVDSHITAPQSNITSSSWSPNSYTYSNDGDPEVEEAFFQSSGSVVSEGGVLVTSVFTVKNSSGQLVYSEMSNTTLYTRTDFFHYFAYSDKIDDTFTEGTFTFNVTLYFNTVYDDSVEYTYTLSTTEAENYYYTISRDYDGNTLDDYINIQIRSGDNSGALWETNTSILYNNTSTGQNQTVDYRQFKSQSDEYGYYEAQLEYFAEYNGTYFIVIETYKDGVLFDLYEEAVTLTLLDYYYSYQIELYADDYVDYDEIYFQVSADYYLESAAPFEVVLELIHDTGAVNTTVSELVYTDLFTGIGWFNHYEYIYVPVEGQYYGSVSVMFNNTVIESEIVDLGTLLPLGIFEVGTTLSINSPDVDGNGLKELVTPNVGWYDNFGYEIFYNITISLDGVVKQQNTGNETSESGELKIIYVPDEVGSYYVEIYIYVDGILFDDRTTTISAEVRDGEIITDLRASAIDTTGDAAFYDAQNAPNLIDTSYQVLSLVSGDTTVEMVVELWYFNETLGDYVSMGTSSDVKDYSYGVTSNLNVDYSVPLDGDYVVSISLFQDSVLYEQTQYNLLFASTNSDGFILGYGYEFEFRRLANSEIKQAIDFNLYLRNVLSTVQTLEVQSNIYLWDEVTGTWETYDSFWMNLTVAPMDNDRISMLYHIVEEGMYYVEMLSYLNSVLISCSGGSDYLLVSPQYIDAESGRNRIDEDDNGDDEAWDAIVSVYYNSDTDFTIQFDMDIYFYDEVTGTWIYIMTISDSWTVAAGSGYDEEYVVYRFIPGVEGLYLFESFTYVDGVLVDDFSYDDYLVPLVVYTGPVVVGIGTLEFEEGANVIVEFDVTINHNATYEVYVNDVLSLEGTVSGYQEFSFNLGGLAAGVYNVTILVTDWIGNIVTYETIVTVLAVSTTTSSTTDTSSSTTDTSTTTTSTTSTTSTSTSPTSTSDSSVAETSSTGDTDASGVPFASLWVILSITAITGTRMIRRRN